MAIRSDLNLEMLSRLDISQRTLDRRVAALRITHGPMSGDDARLIIAHEAGVPLEKYGIASDVRDRVQALRASAASTAALQPAPGRSATSDESSRVAATPPRTPTRAARFDDRSFHTIVAARSRRPFTAGLAQDAVLRAFRSVNNRVKNLTGASLDGVKLMGWAFNESSPRLQLSALTSQSEIDEHNGTRHLMQGAILAMRNPRAHEDHWPRDDNENLALDCLALASLLHRLLDIAEGEV